MEQVDDEEVVLVRLGPRRGSEQAEDPAQAEVTEGEGHGRSWSLVANTASSGQRSVNWCPTPRPIMVAGVEHCQLRTAIEVLVLYRHLSNADQQIQG